MLLDGKWLVHDDVAVEDRVLGAGAEEAGECHRRILPIIQPAAKAEPMAAARTIAAMANIESFWVLLSGGLWVAVLAT